MTMYRFLSIFTCFFFFANFSQAEQEYTVSQCSSLIKECFALSDEGRSNCFFSYAHHPFCEGTSIGKLSFKRWSMSSSPRSNASTSPGLLGPKLIDKQCISNFDNKFSVLLLGDSITNEQIERLVPDLDSCITEISIELSRP